MTEEAKYSVRGYCSDNTDGGYDDESPADTFREAKQRAKHMMTEEYLRVVESTIPVVFVELVNTETGEIIAELGKRP